MRQTAVGWRTCGGIAFFAQAIFFAAGGIDAWKRVGLLSLTRRKQNICLEHLFSKYMRVNQKDKHQAVLTVMNRLSLFLRCQGMSRLIFLILSKLSIQKQRLILISFFLFQPMLLMTEVRQSFIA